MITLALPCDGMDSSRRYNYQAQKNYKKSFDGLLPIKMTCAKLLYF
jgi:hypothetical protein